MPPPTGEKSSALGRALTFAAPYLLSFILTWFEYSLYTLLLLTNLTLLPLFWTAFLTKWLLSPLFLILLTTGTLLLAAWLFCLQIVVERVSIPQAWSETKMDCAVIWEEVIARSYGPDVYQTGFEREQGWPYSLDLDFDFRRLYEPSALKPEEEEREREKQKEYRPWWASSPKDVAEYGAYGLMGGANRTPVAEIAGERVRVRRRREVDWSMPSSD